MTGCCKMTTGLIPAIKRKHGVRDTRLTREFA